MWALLHVSHLEVLTSASLMGSPFTVIVKRDGWSFAHRWASFPASPPPAATGQGVSRAFASSQFLWLPFFILVSFSVFPEANLLWLFISPHVHPTIIPSTEHQPFFISLCFSFKTPFRKPLVFRKILQRNLVVELVRGEAIDDSKAKCSR